MSDAFQPQFNFAAVDLAVEDGEALIVDLDGYEGPLHVLLALARNQKVDLLQLSITRLADQYLAFVHTARRAQFSLAADYLVMASWLAYLKSRLLLPKPDKKQPDHDQNISHEPALLSHFVVRAALCQVRIGIADKKSGETKQSQAPQI